MSLEKDFHFKVCDYGSPEYAKILSLRNNVLRNPLGLSFSKEDLAKEKAYIHVGCFKGSDLYATAMLVPQGKTLKVQRVAVKPGFQGEGLGTYLMKYCEQYALAQGFQEVFVHARETAVSFYLKNNYIIESEVFIETTIPHRRMRKVLI